MAKKILVITIAIALTIFGGYKILENKRSTALDELQSASPQQIIAVYDNDSNLLKKNNDSTLQYTLSWINTSVKSLPVETLQSLINKKLPLFINLQIFPRGLISKFDDIIAGDITGGYYDEKLISFLSLLGKSVNPVYIRYNAEMELPSYQYPWQAKSFHEYILSFRHLYILCKKYAPEVKMVWGPNGYPGAEEYWPGDEFTDLISVNLSMQQPFNNCPYPVESTIEEMMRRKFYRMRFMNKPVLFLSTASVNRYNLPPDIFDHLNKKITADIHIYRTPVVPTEHDNAAIKEPGNPYLQLGVFDPSLLLTNQKLITTEHIFPSLQSVMDGSFKKEFDEIIGRKHDVIVTMEAWRDGKLEKDSNLLANVLSGKYDLVWTRLYQIISGVPQTVYLRWGHEMEIPIKRYPWQSQDPVQYIKAFRYFAGFQKPRSSNIKLVWGPAGDRGSVEWWPGEDVVDFVSFAIYGLPDKDINDYNKQISFGTIFNLKYYRMRFTHKPIFITEFGVKGPEAYQKKWLLEAAATINKYPEVKGISYFNFADNPKVWGNAETPDWSISDSTFKSFTTLLKGLPVN